METDFFWLNILITYTMYGNHPSYENGDSFRIDSPSINPIIPQQKDSFHFSRQFRSNTNQSYIMPDCYSLEETANRYYQEYQKLFKENQELNSRLVEVI